MEQEDVQRIIAATLAVGVMARDERKYEDLAYNINDAIDIYKHVLEALAFEEGRESCQHT